MSVRAGTKRVPQQKRSRERFERLLDAGEQLIAEKGYEGFTIAEVTRRADVSTGVVYQRFGNKEGLIYAVHRRMLERMSVSALEESSSIVQDTNLGLEQAVTEAIRAFADATRTEGPVLRTFILRGAVDPEISGPGSEALRNANYAFRAAVMAHRDEIVHPHPDLAVDTVFRMIYAVLILYLAYGPTFESDMYRSWDDLVREMSRSALAYLRFG